MSNSTENNPQAAKSESPGKKTLGMPGKILIGLGIGILTGLFLGELAAPLKVAGDTFVGLLQMTVLPYIVLALIGGIGKLTAKQSRMMLTRVSVIILVLWLIGLVSVLLFGLSLPSQLSASFFSSSLVEDPPRFDFFGLFIPSNPFRSLAENKVPAVVLFCVLSGVAIIGLKEKQKLVDAVGLMLDVMGRVTGFVVRLSPYGVFFIAASAAGTMDLIELARIQGYLVILTVLALAICFVVMPSIISSMTPFTQRDVAPLLRAAFILAFATGKTLIVLPMLIEGIREIFEKRNLSGPESKSTIDILVPLAYSFPHLGRILATAFIPFAAWYVGSPLAAEQYPILLGASTFVHFSTAPVSIPFLLDIMRLPSDLFQLFLVTGVYVGRLTDAVGAAYILAVTVLGTCAITGVLKANWRRIGILGGGVVAFALVIVVGGRAYLNATSSSTYDKSNVIASMQVYERDVKTKIVEPRPNPVPLRDGQSHLSRITERGTMRIGFDADSLPFSYFNADDQLVGFDIEIIEGLAQGLGVTIEYVPVSQKSAVGEELRDDFYDIAVGGFVNTVQNSQDYPSAEPHMYLNMALVVPDYRDKEFSDMASISALDDLRIGAVSSGSFPGKLKELMPQADIVMLNSPLEFFERRGAGQEIDAFLFSAEAGSAWTMLYPEYQVTTPFPRNIRIPVVFPYSGTADPEMDEFIDNWVLLSNNDGTYEFSYNYWILGEGTGEEQPRWSVIRDVLHWVD